MEQNFKVGDLVVGDSISDHMYMVTNSKIVCRVSSVFNDGFITLEPVFHTATKNLVDKYLSKSSFEVNAERFELYDTNDYKVQLI